MLGALPVADGFPNEWPAPEWELSIKGRVPRVATPVPQKAGSQGSPELAVVAHTFIPSAWESEADGSLSPRPACSTW